MIDLKTASTQEITAYFLNEVNSYCFCPAKITEEQRKSKQMKDLDICWIKTISSHTYGTDLRNEAAAKKGRQLADIPFIKKKIELMDNSKMEEVAKMMEMGHRTLQQTFSRLVFYHLLQTCDKKESETLLKVMGDSFYMLPLI